MTKVIQIELAKLEEEFEIKILYAVESGSRAWGFASTNSDWDVRFIYLHTLDWYLEINERRDNIEKMLPNDIDLAGWELQKALRLNYYFKNQDELKMLLQKTFHRDIDLIEEKNIKNIYLAENINKKKQLLYAKTG